MAQFPQIVNCWNFAPAFEKGEKRKIRCMKNFWMKIKEKVKTLIQTLTVYQMFGCMISHLTKH